VPARARRRITIALGVAATATAGLIAWQLATRSSADAGDAGGAAPPRLGRRGESYQLSFTQELGSGQGPPRRVRIDGLWQSVGPRTPGADPAERAFRLVDARFTPEAGATPADARAFSEAVAHPFLVSYSHRRPVRAAFYPGTAPAVRNLLLTLVVELACEPPPRVDTTSVTTERDLFGRYLAALRADPDRRGIERRKLKYLDLTVPEARSPIQTAIAISITESTWRCRAAADGTLERLDGTEQVTVDTGVPGLAPAVRTELQLEARGEFDAGPVVDALAEARGTLAETPIVTQRVDPAAAGRSADEDLVRGAPLADVLAPFARIAADPASGPLAERHAAIARLAAFVRLEPASVPEIVGQIRAHSQAASALIQALGLANHPEARRTIRIPRRSRAWSRSSTPKTRRCARRPRTPTARRSPPSAGSIPRRPRRGGRGSPAASSRPEAATGGSSRCAPWATPVTRRRCRRSGTPSTTPPRRSARRRSRR
jgi:hypothetical protein